MSFAKIAEARAVKKIVLFVRQQADGAEQHNEFYAQALKDIADDIEKGFWKDIELPKPKKKKVKKK